MGVCGGARTNRPGLMAPPAPPTICGSPLIERAFQRERIVVADESQCGGARDLTGGVERGRYRERRDIPIL